MVSDEAGRVALEIQTARLDAQRSRLAEMRTNSSVLLATTALVASFLGKTSLDRSGLDAANWCALIFLIFSVLFGIRPFWPVRDLERSRTEALMRKLPFGERLLRRSGVQLVWRSTLSVKQVADLAERDASQIRLLAAAELEAHAAVNGDLINHRSIWVMASSILLCAQVIAWVIGLAV
jgi:hypothetical protein